MANIFVASIWAAFIEDGDDGDHRLPPGSPPTRKSSWNLQAHAGLICLTVVKFEGPWFTTQLTISATIGIFSFLVFSYCRTRWPLLFAPRTKLKGSSQCNTSESATTSFGYTGFSPHEAHAHQAFFGWIMPTIRTSEFTVLQIVGLDAAVVSCRCNHFTCRAWHDRFKYSC